MRVITNKHLSRRTVLRGLGTSIALPLLDAMIPAYGIAARAASQPVNRLGAVYIPNGANMRSWVPATEGTTFELPPILQPLAGVRHRLVVLSGLRSNEAYQRPGEGAGDHSRSAAAYLSGVHAKQTEGADIRNGITMDQIAAREFGKHTQLASLELGLEANEISGGCEQGYSCAYGGTISWRSETTPLPMENDPRAVFERLFGASDGTDTQARLARLRRERSILDTSIGSLTRLRKRLGPDDQKKLAEYLESIRNLERRIQLAEAQKDRELPSIERPSGIPDTFEKHVTLMWDLLLLAYQADLTRVGTFMYGREKSSRTYPEIGVPDAHHPVSHHQRRPEMLDKLTRINTFHMKLFADFVRKLGSTPDGDGSLLDHVAIVYGAGMSDSDAHSHTDLPMVLVGGAGSIRGGRHIRCADGTPLTNLHLTLLDKVGVPIDRFGDSTGTIEPLSIA
jgi:hypothetical protein